jgi:transcriptional regulator with XRE-family HTH domain
VISSSQIRAARALLGWSGEELAAKSDVSLKTLRRYEPQEGVPSGSTVTLLRIKSVFEEAGVEFIGDPLVNPGVVLHLK